MRWSLSMIVVRDCRWVGEVMAVPDGKTRLNITLPNDVVALVDEEVKRIGGTRSSVLALCVRDSLDVPEGAEMTPERMIEFLQGVIRERDKVKA